MMAAFCWLGLRLCPHCHPRGLCSGAVTDTSACLSGRDKSRMGREILAVLSMLSPDMSDMSRGRGVCDGLQHAYLPILCAAVSSWCAHVSIDLPQKCPVGAVCLFQASAGQTDGATGPCMSAAVGLTAHISSCPAKPQQAPSCMLPGRALEGSRVTK